jgi:cation diffusion facilitator CzcD-associated flavoprotein CzcO
MRATAQQVDYDAVVVGAGIGGIYACHRLVDSGLSVLGIEGAADVGGVWFHNRYPGARVDLEGLWYCYHDPELYREWQWTERYPAQPELLRYLSHAADRWQVRDCFRFQTWLRAASWDEAGHRWMATLNTGQIVSARYLVMTTGQLTVARPPAFPGLEDFQGEWVTTAHWPEPGPHLDGRRIGIIGTSASGVQAIPHLARAAEHLTVFQRTPHYVAPAHNHPLDPERVAQHVGRADRLWAEVITHPGGTDLPLPTGPAADFDETQRTMLLDGAWAYGAHAMNTVFSDQGTDQAVNDIVAEYMRDKIRATVTSPVDAERLMPRAYPIGTHRLAVDIGYYESFNRDNVDLVSLLENPIERITRSGVQLRDGHVDLDLLVLATGFQPFVGAIYHSHITGAGGVPMPTHWQHGPMAYLGLMTSEFPNLFLPTGPGSPSVLANMFAGNEHHVDLIVELVTHMQNHGHTKVEATADEEDRWKTEVDRLSRPLLRYGFDNYMVHVNPDSSRVFMPYPGGFNRYVDICAQRFAADHLGFEFS